MQNKIKNILHYSIVSIFGFSMSFLLLPSYLFFASHGSSVQIRLKQFEDIIVLFLMDSFLVLGLTFLKKIKIIKTEEFTFSKFQSYKVLFVIGLCFIYFHYFFFIENHKARVYDYSEL